MGVPRLGRSLLQLLWAALVAAGCASSGASPGSAGRSRDVITQAEIEKANARNAYELVQTLRPEYMRSRGMTSIRNDPGAGGLPLVYQDGTFFGPIESLANIHPGNIREVRYVNARDATTKYGTGVANGIIEILTR
jgi:hypothetical protein